MPKAVYRSGCRDKHNCPRWDLILVHYSTTRPLWPPSPDPEWTATARQRKQHAVLTNGAVADDARPATSDTSEMPRLWWWVAADHQVVTVTSQPRITRRSKVGAPQRYTIHTVTSPFCKYLPRTPTVVAWMGFSAMFMCLFVCLSVFLHDISKIDAARITKTWHRNVPPWVLETQLFWGQQVKGQGHEKQKHCWRAWVMALVSAGFF